MDKLTAAVQVAGHDPAAVTATEEHSTVNFKVLQHLRDIIRRITAVVGYLLLTGHRDSG